MVKLKGVKCPFCQAVGSTWGENYTRCKSCSKMFPIPENIIQVKPKPIMPVIIGKPYNPLEARVSEPNASLGKNEIGSGTVVNDRSLPMKPLEDKLEIEEPEEPEKEKKVYDGVFKCPTCGIPVKQFQDCSNPNCPEIIWQED